MLRSNKSKSGKKRLLPPSRTQFAWAMEQRSESRTYFHSRAVDWDALGPNRAKIEAAEAEAAAIAAAEAALAQGNTANTNPQTPNAPVRPSMLTPTPTRRMVRPPSHLVFRTKIVTRGPVKPK
jgi:hypothetical protein